MRPLKLSPSTHRPAVHTYTRFSNIQRVGEFNRSKLLERLRYTTPVLENENPLVQLLAHLSINPEWDFQYLCEWIKFKKESAASLLGLTSVYESGRVTRNAVYGKGYQEILVLSPSKDNYADYLLVDQQQRCPIIPIASNETLIDYVTLSESPDVDGSRESRYAIVAIDIACLAINYWEFLRSNPYKGADPHHFLAGLPLLNARLLAQRVAMFNVIYEAVVGEQPVPNKITQRSPAPLNSLGEIIPPYLRKVVADCCEVGVYDENQFFARFQPWVALDVDPLLLTAGLYNSYTQTNWVWQFPIIKLFTVILKANKLAGAPSGSIGGMVKTWSLQDITGMIRNYAPRPFDDVYRTAVANLLDIVR